MLSIVSHVQADDGAFVVGGQATNLWAWFYRDKIPRQREEQIFTSIDVDYFGEAGVARMLADALGGNVRRPSQDAMNTPSTAVVEIEIGGRSVSIDFLNKILGIKNREFAKGVSELKFPAESEGRVGEVMIPVMHPVLCLKSRIANIMHPATRRQDATALDQARAAHHVMIAYIDHAINDGAHRETAACFQGLFTYLRRDEFGRRAHLETPVDPLGILRAFADDPRIDERYRQKNLAIQITEIETFRAGLEERIAPDRKRARGRKGPRGQAILDELKAKYGSISAAIAKTKANAASESVTSDATQKTKGTGIAD